MSQRDVPDWFAFYVYEFLCDAKVRAMTLNQVGAYVLLLLSQWIEGSIPSDIPALALLLKQTEAEMEILWAGVGPCFTPHPTEEGRLIQARLEEERAVTIERIEKARDRERQRREARKASVGGACENVRARVDTNDTRMAHVSESCTVLSPICSKDSKKGETDAKCDEFTRLYPAHRLDNYGAQLFISSDDQNGILARLRLAVKSQAWTEEGGKFVPKASKWIMEGAPGPSTQPTPAPKPWKADW